MYLRGAIAMILAPHDEGGPGRSSGAALTATWTGLAARSRRSFLFALQAAKTSHGEVVVAELLLSQVVVPVDHLVVERPGGALRRAEYVGAFVAVLEAA